MRAWVFGPRTKGTYILELILDRASRICVGRFGQHAFEPGAYYYVGSAFGPGGLSARLSHHLRGTASPRWHIDYFCNSADIANVWAAPTASEHQWAAIFLSLSGVKIPVARFGASDCRCVSHLFYFRSPLTSRRIHQLTGARAVSHHLLQLP